MFDGRVGRFRLLQGTHQSTPVDCIACDARFYPAPRHLSGRVIVCDDCTHRASWVRTQVMGHRFYAASMSDRAAVTEALVLIRALERESHGRRSR
jgi:hypothetical protein